MFTNGILGKAFCLLPMAVVSWSLLNMDCLGQPVPRFVPPAPLGAPNVVVGPGTNPFGSQPLAIGPAPLVLNQQIDPRTAFPTPRGYTVAPFQTRRPTPFEAAPPVLAVPSPIWPRTISGQPTVPETVELLLPIGNLRLTVSESFINRLIARDEQRPGEVQDFILGAQVSGHQTTATRLRFDLIPAGDNARGAFVLNGTTQSETTGVTPQARVDVASQQEFVAVKDLFFDGMKFSTRHAVVHVRAKNQTLGAVTPLTGTLFGGIANRIAYREAERRRPEAEAVARDRVAERVYPEFDNDIDKQLASANDQLEGRIRRPLRAAGLMPTLQQVYSTDTALHYSAQVGIASKSTSIAPLDGQLAGSGGLKLMAHESLLNALVESSRLKGLKTTDRQIRDLFAPYEVKLTGDELEESQPPIALPGMENIVTDIEFDETNPMSIRIEREQLFVTIRAKFKPAGQDVLPNLAVTIPYQTALVDDKIMVMPGKVQVTALEDGEGTPTPSVAIKMITHAIEANLSKLAFDRALPASLWTFGGTVPRIVSIHAKDGWAGISID